MKTLNITLSDKDMIRYNIKSEDMRFDQLIEKIKNVIASDALAKCQSLAADSGISNISINEITDEVDVSSF